MRVSSKIGGTSSVVFSIVVFLYILKSYCTYLWKAQKNLPYCEFTCITFYTCFFCGLVVYTQVAYMKGMFRWTIFSVRRRCGGGGGRKKVIVKITSFCYFSNHHRNKLKLIFKFSFIHSFIQVFNLLFCCFTERERRFKKKTEQIASLVSSHLILYRRFCIACATERIRI